MEKREHIIKLGYFSRQKFCDVTLGVFSQLYWLFKPDFPLDKRTLKKAMQSDSSTTKWNSLQILTLLAVCNRLRDTVIDLTWQVACFAVWTEVRAVNLCLQVSALCVQRVSFVGLKVWLSLREHVLLAFFVWRVPQCQTRLTTELDLSVHLGFSASRG